MGRACDPEIQLEWLGNRPVEETMTGYDATGWDASTWILHAMYENPSLTGLGTHDDLHKRRLIASDIAPVIIGEVNLDEATTVTGTPLGFVIRPGQPWQRVRWREYLARTPEATGDRTYPPCHRWFPPGSWPVSIEPPSEGSLDEESLHALLQILGAHSPAGPETECAAFYGALPAGDFDSLHVWQGPLEAVPNLIEDNGGPYSSSPTNLWPADRSWFVWTDWDLQGTKVSGSRALIRATRSTDQLETVDWTPQHP